jgi:hypothetical protein
VEPTPQSTSTLSQPHPAQGAREPGSQGSEAAGPAGQRARQRPGQRPGSKSLFRHGFDVATSTEQ